MSNCYPIKLSPHVVTPIWGSEHWLLSTRENAASVVQNGPFAGLGLGELFAQQPEWFGTNCAGKDFPLLIKFIDANDDLSIQVHPSDNDTDVLLAGEAGKTECWYILSATPSAKLVLGFRETITKEQFAKAIAENTIMDHVQSYNVKPGDFFYIPAGTLHAIGKGVRLAEVQQNSDTTYRVYDYNRMQNGAPRPLHIAQAMAVTELAPFEPAPQPSDALVQNELFTLKSCSGPTGFCGHVGTDNFHSLVFIEADDNCMLTCPNCPPLPVGKDDSVFLPAGLGDYRVEGNCKALLTTV